MKYAKLGSSGTVVSTIALGTMYFGDETPEEEAFKILDAFVEEGGNLVDTADVYAKSVSEQVIGHWFASRPSDITNKVVLATKGRSPNGTDVNDVGLSRRHLHQALNASLRRLGVESIDLYQLHASDMKTPIEETVAFLGDAIAAGKIHYIGLSNFTGWQIQLFVSTARAMGVPLPVTLQPQYSLLSREIEWEVIPAAIYNGLGLLPWSPLAGGFLAGKYKRGSIPPSNTRAGSKKELYQWTMEEYALSDRNWETIEAVEKIASESGLPPSQVALSWLINRPGVTAPIVGARTMKHLIDNLGAADLTLNEQATTMLDSLSKPKSGGYPYGEFGAWQRSRFIPDGSAAPDLPFIGGSKTPLG